MADSKPKMELWESVCTTDKAYTREKSEPYRHTDINATYMFRRATEVFGPLGQGWGYSILEIDWRENGLVVVLLSLWHCWGGEKSEPVNVIGSKIAEYDTVERENKPSRHVIDDEAPKKACSDAIKKWRTYLSHAPSDNDAGDIV